MHVVAVGSTNPTKVRSVRSVFRRYFGMDIRVRGVSVSSGVSEQPIGRDVIFQGASNRASAALAAVPDAVYGVGIEGGLEKRPYGWFESSLVVIVNRKGEIGIGSSGGLVLPEHMISTMLHKGMTLEQAIDTAFGTTNIGEKEGMFGIMTKGYVTRSQGVAHGVAFALARFLHENFYSGAVVHQK